MEQISTSLIATNSSGPPSWLYKEPNISNIIANNSTQTQSSYKNKKMAIKMKENSVSLVLIFVFILLVTKPETTSATRKLVPFSNILLAQQFGIDTKHPLTCGAVGDICTPFSPCCQNCNCYGVCVPKGFPYDFETC